MLGSVKQAYMLLCGYSNLRLQRVSTKRMREEVYNTLAFTRAIADCLTASTFRLGPFEHFAHFFPCSIPFAPAFAGCRMH